MCGDTAQPIRGAVNDGAGDILTDNQVTGRAGMAPTLTEDRRMADGTIIPPEYKHLSGEGFRLVVVSGISRRRRGKP